jgi:hypothetical protein
VLVASNAKLMPASRRVTRNVVFKRIRYSPQVIFLNASNKPPAGIRLRDGRSMLACGGPLPGGVGGRA